jgi:preprotein translocase subunit SecG
VVVLTAILNTLLVLLSLFLICLVLIQRGKGGGLAGAFGGAGGSSAFGTKAGDTFTRITVVTASIWILLAMLLVILTSHQPSSAFDSEPTSLTTEKKEKDLGSSKSTTDGKAPTAVDSAPKAPAPPADGKVPALPETSSNFPLTPGNAPPPSPTSK